MTQTLQTSRTTVVLLLVLALAHSAFGPSRAAYGAPSESYVRIENRWKPDQQINVETGALASSPAQPGWFSADWIFEPVADGNYVRIKNRFTGAYIHQQNGRLEAGAMQRDWQSAMWQTEPADDGFYRLKNRKTGDYLNIENGTLEVGKALPGWQSAMWKLTGYVATFSTKAEAVRTSYDSNRYVRNTTATNEEWNWSGGVPFTRTIYNPLDGGVLLKYKQTVAQRNSDGCSGPTGEPWRTIFQQPCLAHDTNYDAPFDLAGFPKYKRGDSIGKEIADYLLLKDMLLTKSAQADITHSLIETAAYTWYRAVSDFGGYRGSSENKEILQKGGVVTVQNNGGYIMGLRVTWKDPQGVERVEEITNSVGRAAAIPLSAGASNIDVECWAVGGKQIFKKSFPTADMYAFTVTGTTLSPFVADGLQDNSVGAAFVDAGKAVQTFVEGEKTPAGERAIKFNNQAGYVASLTVMYFVNQKVGDVTVPMPKVLSTPQISLGFTRPLIIPRDIVLTNPITVTIEGVGTVKNPVFTTTVPTNFTGELCYKAWGTIFDAQGGSCN
jgi:hypothetical protein